MNHFLHYSGGVCVCVCACVCACVCVCETSKYSTHYTLEHKHDSLTSCLDLLEVNTHIHTQTYTNTHTQLNIRTQDVAAAGSLEEWAAHQDLPGNSDAEGGMLIASMMRRSTESVRSSKGSGLFLSRLSSDSNDARGRNDTRVHDSIQESQDENDPTSLISIKCEKPELQSRGLKASSQSPSSSPTKPAKPNRACALLPTLVSKRSSAGTCGTNQEGLLLEKLPDAPPSRDNSPSPPPPPDVLTLLHETPSSLPEITHQRQRTESFYEPPPLENNPSLTVPPPPVEESPPPSPRLSIFSSQDSMPPPPPMLFIEGEEDDKFDEEELLRQIIEKNQTPVSDWTEEATDWTEEATRSSKGSIVSRLRQTLLRSKFLHHSLKPEILISNKKDTKRATLNFGTKKKSIMKRITGTLRRSRNHTISK